MSTFVCDVFLIDSESREVITGRPHSAKRVRATRPMKDSYKALHTQPFLAIVGFGSFVCARACHFASCPGPDDFV